MMASLFRTLFLLVQKLVGRGTNDFKSAKFNVIRFVGTVFLTIMLSITVVLAIKSIGLSLTVIELREEIVFLKEEIDDYDIFIDVCEVKINSTI